MGEQLRDELERGAALTDFVEEDDVTDAAPGEGDGGGGSAPTGADDQRKA